MYYVNCTSDRELCARHNIRGFPTISAFRGLGWLGTSSCIHGDGDKKLQLSTRTDYHGVITVTEFKTSVKVYNFMGTKLCSSPMNIFMDTYPTFEIHIIKGPMNKKNHSFSFFLNKIMSDNFKILSGICSCHLNIILVYTDLSKY